MRKESLTYRDLLRRLLAGRLLRLEERRVAEAILAIPDLVELARRMGELLEGVADRGGVIRLGRRPEDARTVHRYLDPATNDTWSVEMPGPAALRPPEDAPGAKRPGEAPTPRGEARSTPTVNTPPPATAAGAPTAPAAPAVRPAPRSDAPSPPAGPPRLVRTVEEVHVPPGIAARFADPSGEPQRTLFSAFAPCRTHEDLSEALSPLREQLVRATGATDVRIHLLTEPPALLTPLPLWGQTPRPHLALGARVTPASLGERRVLHVPNLSLPDAEAPETERGALVSVPLVSGDRVVGLMEVRRDTPGAFEADELALFVLTASVAAGSMVRAEVLEKLIFLDRLTGLWNRAYFDDQIEREIERANRMGTSLALLMSDLDHFKRINDRYGHLVGDQALAHVAAIIRSNIRQIDVAARYGGEEFAILLPSITRARAARTAERLRRVVADTKFSDVVPDLAEARLSISLGFALYPDDAATAKQLIDRADRVALYTAKSRGRNRVVPWSAAPEVPPVGTPPAP